MARKDELIFGIAIIFIYLAVSKVQFFSAALDPGVYQSVPTVDYASVIDFTRSCNLQFSGTTSAIHQGFLIRISNPEDIETWKNYRFDTEKSYYARVDTPTSILYSGINVEGEAQIGNAYYIAIGSSFAPNSQFPCQNVYHIEMIRPASAPAPPNPIAPSISLFQQVIDSIIDFLQSLFGISLLSVVGPNEVPPGASMTFVIDMTADVPDSDFSDGTYQQQFGGWALVDANGNIIQNSEWLKISDRFQSAPVLIAPTAQGNYVMTAVIIRYDQVYDSATAAWSVPSEPVIAAKEGFPFTVKSAASVPTQPIVISPPQSIFSSIINAILDFINGIIDFFT